MINSCFVIYEIYCDSIYKGELVSLSTLHNLDNEFVDERVNFVCDYYYCFKSKGLEIWLKVVETR